MNRKSPTPSHRYPAFAPWNRPGALRGAVPFNIAIIGGGRRCKELLQFLSSDDLSAAPVKILGIADPDLNAPGIQEAKKRGVYVTEDFRELYRLDGLQLIIELTGSPQVSDLICQTKPPHVSLMDHRGAMLLWHLIHIEKEKSRLEKERKAFEQKEKEHIQVILNSMPYRIMVVNRNLTIDIVNETFLKDFGLSLSEVVGKPCYKVRHGLDRPCKEYGQVCYLEEGFKRTSDKPFYSFYKEYAHDSGSPRFDVITLAPIFDEAGDIVQILEVSRDVTDRIRLEKEAEKSKTFFQNVIESTVDGIVVVDTKGNVLIFNEGMERLTGYSADEIMDRGHLSSFYDIEVAKENMRKMRSDNYGPPGKLNPTSMTITTKTGEKIPVTLSASIITIDGKEVGSVGVFRDMREILRMRKELEDAHLQLVRSEKIASVGRMAAGVAHEINNPLSGILIYAELLKNSLKGDMHYCDDIQEIIDQTLRCKKIVAELLEFSRQSVGKVSSFGLQSLITKCLNILINQASFQNIDVITDIEEDMPPMVGDFGQLQQVFTNLFINAADAMEGKGRLSIKAKYDKDNEKFIIKVSDTGPGIPEEFRDKIFDIFFTTKPVGKGTGLGLSISQNIISLHGGIIRVYCPPEGGTTFVIELPSGLEEKSSQEPVFVEMT